MFSIQSKFVWFLISTTTLIIFCFLLTAHAFIPHNHVYDTFSAGLLSSLHSGVAERELELVFFSALIVALVFPRQTLVTRLPLGFRFHAQGPEVLSLLTLHVAFAGGILNPKPY